MLIYLLISTICNGGKVQYCEIITNSNNVDKKVFVFCLNLDVVFYFAEKEWVFFFSPFPLGGSFAI